MSIKPGMSVLPDPSMIRSPVGIGSVPTPDRIDATDPDDDGPMRLHRIGDVVPYGDVTDDEVLGDNVLNDTVERACVAPWNRRFSHKYARAHTRC